jgi:hypothetical protein
MSSMPTLQTNSGPSRKDDREEGEVTPPADGVTAPVPPVGTSTSAAPATGNGGPDANTCGDADAGGDGNAGGDQNPERDQNPDEDEVPPQPDPGWRDEATLKDIGHSICRFLKITN